MKACKDCRHYRVSLLDRLFWDPAISAKCGAAEPEYDKVTGETWIPRPRCWQMRMSGPCGPEGKLWGPF